jgi:hypothetical protein
MGFVVVMIFGAMLLMAFISGVIGILCTRSIRDLFPGLLFGLPAILLSMLVFIFFIGAQSWVGIVAVPTLMIGMIVVWRGLRTGQKQRDRISGVLVCVGVVLVGIILLKYPDIPAIFFKFLPGIPIL